MKYNASRAARDPVYAAVNKIAVAACEMRDARAKLLAIAAGTAPARPLRMRRVFGCGGVIKVRTAKQPQAWLLLEASLAAQAEELCWTIHKHMLNALGEQTRPKRKPPAKKLAKKPRTRKA